MLVQAKAGTWYQIIVELLDPFLSKLCGFRQSSYLFRPSGKWGKKPAASQRVAVE
jgi:hypothetical protein